MENHRSKICIWFVILKGKIIDLTFVFVIFVFMFVIVFGFVCVCDFGPKNHKSKFAFLILGLAGHEGTGPLGA